MCEEILPECVGLYQMTQRRPLGFSLEFRHSALHRIPQSRPEEEQEASFEEPIKEAMV
jgi:hypothetical protein